MTKTYGTKYDEVKNLGVTEIAKRMRADIKRAKADGLLPTRWNYSVTTDKFSGGASIEVRVRDCADAWVAQDDSLCYQYAYCTLGMHARHCPAAEHLTDEAEAALAVLKQIHGSYNYDGSDVITDYFDVNYYGSAQVESLWDAQFRAREKARKAAAKAAREVAA